MSQQGATEHGRKNFVGTTSARDVQDVSRLGCCELDRGNVCSLTPSLLGVSKVAACQEPMVMRFLPSPAY